MFGTKSFAPTFIVAPKCPHFVGAWNAAAVAFNIVIDKGDSKGGQRAMAPVKSLAPFGPRNGPK